MKEGRKEETDALGICVCVCVCWCRNVCRGVCRGVVEETNLSFSYLALVLLAEDRRAGLVDWRAGMGACVRVGDGGVVISHSTSTHNVTTHHV